MEIFYSKLSNWLGVRKNELFITEGVSGAIKSLVETLSYPGKNNIIFPYPTFALYPVYCKMFDLKPIYIGYTNNYKVDFDKLLDSINN